MPTIEEITAVDDELVDAFEQLTPQLSSSNPAPSRAALAEIVASPASVLFVARADDGGIVGSLTLAMFRIPTGLRAWIEDVVVDERVRGQGIGALLNEAAIERLVGAVLLENNEEWLTTRRYMPLEAIAKIGQPQTIEPAALTVATA